MNELADTLFAFGFMIFGIAFLIWVVHYISMQFDKDRAHELNMNREFGLHDVTKAKALAQLPKQETPTDSKK